MNWEIRDLPSNHLCAPIWNSNDAAPRVNVSPAQREWKPRVRLVDRV
jgi:hypothetical protein